MSFSIKNAAVSAVSLVFCVSGAFSAACAGDSGGSAEPAVRPLDAAVKHYGQTFAEWCASYIQYTNRYHEPDCANPLIDTTGANCAVDQDPKSPVFFLVGAFGGVATRKCTVPKEKALFFPIMNVSGDNAGVPADKVLTPPQVKTYVQGVFDNLAPKRLWLKVDGANIGSLDKGRVPPVPYTIDLGDGKGNAYTCNNIDGVAGKFDGYVAGYWVMLPPLSAGMHDVEFGVERGVDPLTGDPAQPSFMLDVHYELEVK